MSKICPFMSNSEKLVECKADCQLNIEGDCAFYVKAIVLSGTGIHLEKIDEKLDSIEKASWKGANALYNEFG